MSGIKVQLPDGDAQLVFGYDKTDLLRRESGWEVVHKETPTVRAYLRRKSAETVVSPIDGKERPVFHVSHIGTARCSPVDKNVWAIGRKIALARAIKDLPRPIRKGIWAAYWAASPKPKVGARRR